MGWAMFENAMLATSGLSPSPSTSTASGATAISTCQSASRTSCGSMMERSSRCRRNSGLTRAAWFGGLRSLITTASPSPSYDSGCRPRRTQAH
eukprot:15050718-Alexandrium_andersonii.AAC.1